MTSVGKNTKTVKRAMGDIYEQRACQLLLEQGLQICQTNYAVAGVGEIDIIAIEQRQLRDKIVSQLVFVEVRSRRQSRYADAIGSITPAKQQRIIKTAEHFLQNHPEYQAYACRFDVIGFLLDQTGKTVCEWLSGAFTA